MSELVSILIPSYNHARYIEETILSALNQTHLATEVIVIDDGSTDGSVEILKSLSELYNFTLICQENAGLSRTLNRGVEISRGKYISVLGSDDTFSPDKIEHLLSIYRRFPDAAFVAGDATFMDHNGDDLLFNNNSSFIQHYSKQTAATDIYEVTYLEILLRNFIPAMGVLIRKDNLESVGLFPTQYRMEDYPTWLALLRTRNAIISSKAVARYRIHDKNSITTHRRHFVHEQISIMLGELMQYHSISAACIIIKKLVALSIIKLMFKFRLKK